MKPILLINLKAYKEGTGENALKLAKIADSFASENVEIILAVQPVDIKLISDNGGLKVFSQHVDPIGYGKYTGWILPESIKQAGASGTLLNHSERRMEPETIEKSIKRCKELKLTTVVCTPAVEEGERIAEFEPDFIAFESPELIGTLKSVSRLEPESVKRFVEAAKKINPKVIPLCGAGVANSEDVRAAIKLGTSGVILATAVVKSRKPEKIIRELVEGFSK
ncbi:MAG: triose-phosphate isomerase [Candidatus Aenigmatarchaeota archaeon]|nr:MAG: triose-phosphate isomerase [Candidatus Aenigmarchaeota archaeon]